MRTIKSLGAAVAATAVACAFSAPAMADQIGGGPGEPLISGDLESHGALHCQPAVEFFLGTDLPAGTAPGVIVATGTGKFIVTGPPGGYCEAVAAELGL